MSEENQKWMWKFREINEEEKKSLMTVAQIKMLNLKDQLSNFGQLGLCDPTEDDTDYIDLTLLRIKESDFWEKDQQYPVKLTFLPNITFIRKIIRALHHVQNKSDPLSEFGF
jgi:hypothetical protein